MLHNQNLQRVHHWHELVSVLSLINTFVFISLLLKTFKVFIVKQNKIGSLYGTMLSELEKHKDLLQIKGQ